MSDRVVISGLRAFGHHGVLAHERRDGQEFVVDVAIEFDTRDAAASDSLTDTVDYAALAQRLHEVVTGEPVALLETLAQRLAEVCLADPRVSAAEVTVHKPSAPVPVAVGDVAVFVRRTRDRA